VLPLVVLSMVVCAEPARVLVLEIRADGVEETTARVVRDEIAAALAGDARIEALSTEDIRRAVSLDAERRAVGCVDDSCIAEVGQAMGARYVVHGSISALGSMRIVRLNAMDTAANTLLVRETVEARTDEELLPLVRVAVGRLRLRLLDAVAPPTPGPSGLQIGGSVIGGVGIVAAGIGTAMMALAWPTFSDTTSADFKGRAEAQTQGQLGTGLLIGGVVVAAVGGTLFVVGGTP
jgi:hypothetical protein